MSQENFQTYYQLQFDRIDKLESKRETFSNLIITISIAMLAFGYSNEYKWDEYFKTLNAILLIGLNFVSVSFINESHILIKMHQERAGKALERYAPELLEINLSVPKPDNEKNLFSRKRLYKYVHYSFSMVGILIIIIQLYHFFCTCNPK
jgi:hypothetical protein